MKRWSGKTELIKKGPHSPLHLLTNGKLFNFPESHISYHEAELSINSGRKKKKAEYIRFKKMKYLYLLMIFFLLIVQLFLFSYWNSVCKDNIYEKVKRRILKIGKRIGTEITLLFMSNSVFISFSHFLIKNPGGLNVFSPIHMTSLPKADHE